MGRRKILNFKNKEDFNMKIEKEELRSMVKGFYEGVDSKDLNRSEVMNELNWLLDEQLGDKIMEVTVELLEARQHTNEIEATLKISIEELNIEENLYLYRTAA